MSVPGPAGVPGATGLPSTASLPSSTGLPAVNQASEPEWVRKGSASTQKAYETALSFEATLVEQLSKSLTSTSGLGGEGSAEGESEEGGGANSGELSSLLPQALTGGVMRAGGLGLAAQMTRQLQGAQGASQPHLTGGTAATAGAGGAVAPGATAGASMAPGEAPAASVAPAITNRSAAKTGGTAA